MGWFWRVGLWRGWAGSVDVQFTKTIARLHPRVPSNYWQFCEGRLTLIDRRKTVLVSRCRVAPQQWLLSLVSNDKLLRLALTLALWAPPLNYTYETPQRRCRTHSRWRRGLHSLHAPGTAAALLAGNRALGVYITLFHVPAAGQRSRADTLTTRGPAISASNQAREHSPHTTLGA